MLEIAPGTYCMLYKLNYYFYHSRYRPLYNRLVLLKRPGESFSKYFFFLEKNIFPRRLVFFLLRCAVA